MEDTTGTDTTTPEYETVEDTGYDTGYSTSTPRDPISNFFGGIFFIIILALIIIFMVILMIYRGVSWIGTTATGGTKKEGFELPKSGPRPCPGYDERCADFPALY
jgi:hypothetical protein